MFVETDFSLLSDENIKEITPAHLQEVRLRLKVLQTLAIQNAEQNAERQRQEYNAKTKIPTDKVGDKICGQTASVRKTPI
jgi:Tfp pilus assembly protein FimV